MSCSASRTHHAHSALCSFAALLLQEAEAQQQQLQQNNEQLVEAIIAERDRLQQQVAAFSTDSQTLR